MGDPLKKVQDGERLRIPAAAYNAFVDAARKVRAEQQSVAANPLRSTRSTSIVLVKNDSGGTVGRFGILGIDGPIVSPSANLDQFKEQVAIVGTQPDSAEHFGRLCVLLEPLANGAIGQAVVDGVVCVRLNVIDETDTTADIEHGQTGRLQSAGDSGSAAILWKEAGTGEKWAVVRLQGAGSPLDIRLMYLDEDLPQGGQANATQAIWNGSAWLPTGPQETVYDAPEYGPVAQQKFVIVVRSPASGRLELLSVPPGGGAELTLVYLNVDLTRGGSASATVVVWDGDSWEVSGPVVTVYDTPRYGPAQQGEFAVVTLSPTSGRLEIVSLPPKSGERLWFSFTGLQPMGKNENQTVVLVTRTWGATPPAELLALPASFTVFNTDHIFIGEYQKKGRAQYDDVLGRMEIEWWECPTGAGGYSSSQQTSPGYSLSAPPPPSGF